MYVLVHWKKMIVFTKMPLNDWNMFLKYVFRNYQKLLEMALFISSKTFLELENTVFLGHYHIIGLQWRLVRRCRGGSASRPYHTVSTNYVFVEAVPRPSLQIICRGGLGTPAAPTNRFVGTATVPTAPTNHFSAKKNNKFTIQIRPEHIFFMHNSIMTYLLLRLY